MALPFLLRSKQRKYKREIFNAPLRPDVFAAAFSGNNFLKMLELEVVPERSLGCEQWEFILGNIIECFPSSVVMRPIILLYERAFCISLQFVCSFLLLYSFNFRDAFFTSSLHNAVPGRCYKEGPSNLQ